MDLLETSQKSEIGKVDDFGPSRLADRARKGWCACQCCQTREIDLAGALGLLNQRDHRQATLSVSTATYHFPSLVAHFFDAPPRV